MKFAEIRSQVDTDARALRPHIVVLTVITAVLFAIGWAIGAVFRAVWLVIAWAWAASVVGFKVASKRDEAGS